MHSFTKAEVERLKGVMSCQVDRYRAPYERRAADHPRRCVFAGTTNRDDWNRDETGARRFWPVVCGHIDLDWLTQHRDQLLAEAVYKFKNGATWWEVPREHAEREQDARRVEDPWQPIIADWLIGRTETTTNEILQPLHPRWTRPDDQGRPDARRGGSAPPPMEKGVPRRPAETCSLLGAGRVNYHAYHLCATSHVALNWTVINCLYHLNHLNYLSLCMMIVI